MAEDDKEFNWDMSADAVHAMRDVAQKWLGFNCTFVDDDMKVIASLAQRAVLAGLDADFRPEMRRSFRDAAEPHRAEQEATIGGPIRRQTFPPRADEQATGAAP